MRPSLSKRRRSIGPGTIWKNVLENSRDMIFRVDSDDVLVSFNKGGESALGYTLDDLSGLKMKDLAEDPHDFESLAVQCLRKKEAVRDEIYFRHKTGRIVYCRVILSPLTNTRGEVIGMGGCVPGHNRLEEVQGRPHPGGPHG